MNNDKRKQRISMFIDPDTLRDFKETAERTEVPYQRLIQQALKHARKVYLPKWEEAWKEL